LDLNILNSKAKILPTQELLAITESFVGSEELTGGYEQLYLLRYNDV
jgi:hypothetical protein